MSLYIWIKLVHISAIMVWSAGLLYLPGLFAEHVRAAGQEDFQRVRYMTRLVFVGVASPAAVIAVVSGTILIPFVASLGGWLILKLILVSGMVLLHVYYGRLMGLLFTRPRLRGPWSHLLLICPAVMLILGVVYLVTGKPV